MKNTLKGNLLYGQSGGPTSVINSSAYGLFLESSKHKDIIEKSYALKYGISGMLHDDVIEIENIHDYKKLLNTPGAYFGSNRHKLKDYQEDESEYKIILEFFKKYNIRYFFYNGGNDSMDTIKKISSYFEEKDYLCRCIGINKTVDNDLCGCYFSLGYASAAKYIVNSVISIYLDDLSYKKGRVNVVEAMGRTAGWLAASAKYAKLKGCEPDLIYTAEMEFDLDDFLDRVNEIYSKKKHCLVVVSEGIKDKNGNFITEMSDMVDNFGHIQLGGVSITLASLITQKLGIKTRYFELSTLQRANSICPSKIEINHAIKLSSYALKQALKGETIKVATIKYDGQKITYGLEKIEDIANKERLIPEEFLDEENKTIKDSFIEYMNPFMDDLMDILEK